MDNAYEEVQRNSWGNNPILRVQKTKIWVIPQFVFTLLEYSLPFSNPSITPLIPYDYSFDHFSPSTLPSTIQSSLYPFQLTGVNFGLSAHGRLLLCDEMGVGKTIQSLALAYLYRKDWPLLIICPSSLKLTWKDEILKWLDHLQAEDIQVFNKGMEKFEEDKLIYILSYTLATRLVGVIENRNFGVVVLDEAHYLKARDSKRSRALVPVVMKAKRVMWLTGTPILARPNEMFNLVRIVRPDVFVRFKEFGERYWSPKPGFFGTDWSGNANMAELEWW
jgi:SWI/SNF-related matrix-associated actin-dependent regulator of chromatin subfamily A-like protein 1